MEWMCLIRSEGCFALVLYLLNGIQLKTTQNFQPWPGTGHIGLHTMMNVQPASFICTFPIDEVAAEYLGAYLNHTERASCPRA